MRAGERTTVAIGQSHHVAAIRSADHESAEPIVDFLKRYRFSTGTVVAVGLRRGAATVRAFPYGALAEREERVRYPLPVVARPHFGGGRCQSFLREIYIVLIFLFC